MSRENVEVVRRGVDSVNRRDMAAILGDFDEDAEWVEDQRYPGAEIFRGPSGVERSFRKIRVQILGSRDEALEAARPSA